jgi:RNA polymerase sigma-70 factor (subfamily 1)
MARNAEAINEALGEFRAYLETLTCIQIDPRLRSEFSFSDLVQKTLLEAWRDLERIEPLDAAGRKRWLRKMLLNNLKDEIRRVGAQKCDFRLKQSLDAAIEESSIRLAKALEAEETPIIDRLVYDEEKLRVLEALSQLDVRQREVLILQKYHGRTLAQIAEHLGCTVGAVAGLQARGLKELRKHLPDTE